MRSNPRHSRRAAKHRGNRRHVLTDGGVPSVKYRKTIFSLAYSVGSDNKQRARQAITRRSLNCCGGHVETHAVGTAESAGCNVLHRHLHHPVDAPVGRDPHNASSEKAAIPKVALRVDTGAIGQSARESLKKRPPV